MIVVEEPSARRTPTIVMASHQLNLKLCPSVPAVVSGTPIRSGPTGWVVAKPGEKPEAFAASYAEGGGPLHAWLIVTLEVHADMFNPGKRYSISDVDDRGRITFSESDAGPYVPNGASQLVMSAI